MELKDFVAQSLSQVVLGVKEAQSLVAGTGARVAPLMRATIDKESIGSADGDGGQPVYTVDFDVVVSVTAGTGTKGGVAISVGALSLGSAGQSDSKSGQESRIRFKVPLLLPSQAKPNQ